MWVHYSPLAGRWFCQLSFILSSWGGDSFFRGEAGNRRFPRAKCEAFVESVVRARTVQLATQVWLWGGLRQDGKNAPTRQL